MTHKKWTKRLLGLWSLAWMVLLLCGAQMAGAQTGNPQPAILGAAGASNEIVVFPNPGSAPGTQKLVPNLPENALPHGVAYYGSDNALISDFGNSRIYVVKISTAALLDTIPTTGKYDGTGSIAVAPDRNTALAMGNTTSLNVIRGPFTASSQISQVTLPGTIAAYQTQAIVFNNAGRAFVYHTAGISVLDAPYTSVAFTIPVQNSSSGAIAITPSGNTLLVTDLSSNRVGIYQAPFSATSAMTTLAIPGGSQLDGIVVAPDGSKALVVSAGASDVSAISAPFNSSSNVQSLPLPPDIETFEDVSISADSQIALVTGNSSSAPLVRILAPFTTAGAQSTVVPIQNVSNPNRGAGAVRFLPAGLAAGLTIDARSGAPATVASGANLTYTIAYSNTGVVDATGVIIRAPIPAGTTFVSASNGGTLQNGVVVFNIGNLPAGTVNRSVTFTVKVTAAPGSTINSNGYTIEANGVAPIPGPPVTTTVTPAVVVNNPPVVPFGQTITINENTPLNLVLEGADPDNDPLTFSIVTQPQNGTLTLNGNRVIYTPRNGFIGNDSFSYRASDGKAFSNTGTVFIRIERPASSALTVVGGGKLLGTGRIYGIEKRDTKLDFAILVTKSNGVSTGSVVVNKDERGFITSSKITDVTINGKTATIAGEASFNGSGTYRFTITVTDSRNGGSGVFTAQLYTLPAKNGSSSLVASFSGALIPGRPKEAPGFIKVGP